MPGLYDAEDQTQELNRASQALSQLGCHPLPHKVALKRKRRGLEPRGEEGRAGPKSDFDLGLLTP